MTAVPMHAEDDDGVPDALTDVESSPAVLRLPKYYQVKKQLLDFTAAMAAAVPARRPGRAGPPDDSAFLRSGQREVDIGGYRGSLPQRITVIMGRIPHKRGGTTHDRGPDAR